MPNDKSKSSSPVSGNDPLPRDSTTKRAPAESKPTYALHKKKRVPELSQPTLSSAQIARRQKDSVRRKRMFHVWQLLTRGLFGVAVLAVVAALVYFFLLPEKKKDKVVSIDSGTSAITPFEKVIESGNSFELMQYSSKLARASGNSPLPVVMGNLKEKKRIGQRLEAINEDKSSYLAGLEMQLDSLFVLNYLNLTRSLDDEESRRELFEIATRLSSHEETKIARKAQFNLCYFSITEFLADDSDENYEGMKAQVNQAAESMIDDIDSVQKLGQLVKSINSPTRKDQIREFKISIGNILKKSPNEDVVQVGIEIHDNMLTGHIDYQEMNRLILASDEPAIQELGEIVEVVVGSDLVSGAPIAKLISLVENLDQVGMLDLEQEYMAKLRQSVSGISDSNSKLLAENTIRDYEKRKSLKHNIFDFSGSNSEGTPIKLEDLDDKVVVMLFFSLHNPESSFYLGRIRELQYLNNRGVVWLLFNVDNQLDLSRLESLRKTNSKAIYLSATSAPNYLEQCPVSKVPFVLLTDREHRIVSINVDMDHLRLQVETQIDR